ncbi:asparagine synthase (glutamine-hydrolyzing) [Verrucomicrobiota bacterium]
MCSIFGTTIVYPAGTIEKKLSATRFRGPDCTRHCTVGPMTLGHNRLSVIDLDERAHQPFRYDHLHIVFNGEIYNFEELKGRLADRGYRFRTTSDTEVICAAYLHYGTDCVKEFNGMFAFAVYDARANRVFGARDRLGQKPFYYSLSDGDFEFASQPGMIVVRHEHDIDASAVSQYLAWGYIPEPLSVFKGISKLPAGHSFIYEVQTRRFTSSPYWELPKDQDRPAFPDYSRAKEDLHDLLKDSVRLRLRSDVPLGILLSGGVDSSLIAALARSVNDGAVQSFTVAFSEPEFDESGYARSVAEHLGLDHTEIRCSYEEGIDLIEDYLSYYDEPFADSSAIPAMLLAKHTRKAVTVALSGDGGDEGFLGYPRYGKVARLASLYRLPLALREAISVPVAFSRKRWKRRAFKKNFTQRDLRSLYYHKMKGFHDDWIADLSACDNPSHLDYVFNTGKPVLECVSDYDMKTYLNDDINTKMDRASMAFSLEARAPLQDHRIVELSRCLPTDFKYRRGCGKRILKDILYEYVPRSLFDRPKAGFAMPLEHWFRDELREYVLDTLTDRRLASVPNINVGTVTSRIHAHLEGRQDNHRMIWKLLVLVRFLDRSTSVAAEQEGTVKSPMKSYENGESVDDVGDPIRRSASYGGQAESG